MWARNLVYRTVKFNVQTGLELTFMRLYITSFGGYTSDPVKQGTVKRREWREWEKEGKKEGKGREKGGEGRERSKGKVGEERERKEGREGKRMEG